MDIKEIKQIVDLMKRSDLTEFEIEEKDLKLRICRDSGNATYFTGPQAYAAAPVSAPSAEATSAPAAPAAAKEEAGVSVIKSPMVGTFYRAASPDSKPFADIGTKVKADSVVCIIEAMKVMNEINAEIAGTIVDILVENGQAVEYGQPLFKVKA